MKTKKSDTMTLGELKDKYYGEPGSKKRDKLEEGYEDFKLGAMIFAARREKGMTQEQLAEKIGTTKSYISKIENDMKEVRLSTLKRIIEIGLGGQIQLSIIF
ncbi:MAG: helix-turn-helix transcriptional regulator [Bacteroidetes bacterium]|nr:helix-turn-helix transcriptional regulator [Bacteroidota bacterium]